MIAQRISQPAPETDYVQPREYHYTNPPGPGEINASSPHGNPAPNRGIIPVDNMYDFQINRFFPDNAYFVRGNVNVTLGTQNLALQAYAQAGGKVV